MESETKELIWEQVLDDAGVYQPLNGNYENLRIIVQGEKDAWDYFVPNQLLVAQLYDGKWRISNIDGYHFWFKHKFIKTNEELKLV